MPIFSTILVNPVQMINKAIVSAPLINMEKLFDEISPQKIMLKTLNSYFSEPLQVTHKDSSPSLSTVTSKKTVELKNPVEVKPKNLDMSQTIEGRFFYEGRLLNHVSTNSKHGQLLKFFLNSKDCYVTDAFLLEHLNPADSIKGLGYIRDDLIRSLEKDQLKIEIYRNRDKINKGYRLLKISKISN